MLKTLKLVLKIVLKTTLLIVLSSSVLLWTLWLTLPYLSSVWRPLGITLQMHGRPRWSQQRLHLPPLQLQYQGCQLLSASGATLYYPTRYSTSSERRYRWQIALTSLSTNTACWQSVYPQLLTQPSATSKRRPFSLSAWQAKLPPFRLTIDQLDFTTNLIAPAAPATLILTQHAGKLQARYTHPMAILQGTLDQQRRLTLALELKQPLGQYLQQGTLQGEVVLPDQLNSWPEQGQLRAQLRSRTVPQATHAALQWQGANGLLLVTGAPSSPPLLKLPWQFSEQRLQFSDGQWNWPDSHCPLQGTLQLTISDWQRSARTDRGQILDDDSDASGGGAGGGLTATVNGRLQLQHAQWGEATLQAKGRVDHLGLTSAVWQWDHHCQGVAAIPQARWQSHGKGAWKNQHLIVDQLSATADRWQQGSLTGEKLQLTLQTPWRWHYQQHPFATTLQLTAQQLRLPNGRTLRQPTLDVQLKTLKDARNSQDPQDRPAHPWQLSWKSVARAGDLGPVKGQGCWDGRRLQGTLNWRQQSLATLQPLLTPHWDWRLQAGTLNSRADFCVAATQPLTLTGHLQINAGVIGLKGAKNHDQISGITLDLPYRWWHQRWQLGSRGKPATLRIRSLQHRLTLSHITLDAQGYFPYRSDQPLQLSNIAFDTLGGHLSLPLLRLPQQQQPSLLKLTNLDLAQLTALSKNRHVTLNGRVNGEFPVYTDHPQWLIHQGLLHNTTPLISKLDKTIADTLRQQPKISDRVVDWLELLHIHQAQAQIHLDTLGKLTLQAQINGINPQHQEQPVHLNYQHQENLLTLWRSLQASDLLQQQIEQQAPALWRGLP